MSTGTEIPTEVVVGLLLGHPDLHRQCRRRPIQRLNLRFLVHTEHDRVLRRIEIQPDDVGHLRDQFRIGGELECFTAPRLHAVFAPDTCDRAVPDP
ncbi:hypothetical protein A0W34_30200 (plasmid) [Rhodococcus sp. BH4]|nr:hypothetical protein A0W34_30200 [Rhodococcus sp. BH4]